MDVDTNTVVGIVNLAFLFAMWWKLDSKIEKTNGRIEKMNDKIEKTNDKIEKTNDKIEKTNEKTNDKIEKTNDKIEKMNDKIATAEKSLREDSRTAHSEIVTNINRVDKKVDDLKNLLLQGIIARPEVQGAKTSGGNQAA